MVKLLKRLAPVVILLASLVLSAGCGRKGPLVPPKQSPSSVVSAPRDRG